MIGKGNVAMEGVVVLAVKGYDDLVARVGLNLNPRMFGGSASHS